jgi:hypothetical protein
VLRWRTAVRLFVRAGGRLEPCHGHCAVSGARPCDVISSCLSGGFGGDPPSGLIVTGRITEPQRLAQQQAAAVAPRLRGRGDRGLPDLTGGPGPRPGDRRVSGT